MIESLLLSATQISTFDGDQLLTRATGFFFARDERLYVVTSRHVVLDAPSQHFPSRVEIELHVDADNLTRSTGLSMPLYRDGKSLWRQGQDAAGEIDVAVLEVERRALPSTVLLRAFTPAHLLASFDAIEVGSALLIVGFPLGFHDTLHHLPVVRQAVIASSFGLRFQGQGYFLTDARTHRGTSGAPVVMRVPPMAPLGDVRAAEGAPENSGRPGVSSPDLAADNHAELPWKLLGVHAARMDMTTRDLVQDESLGLNCAWYADIVMKLTDESAAARVAGTPDSPTAV